MSCDGFCSLVPSSTAGVNAPAIYFQRLPPWMRSRSACCGSCANDSMMRTNLPEAGDAREDRLMAAQLAYDRSNQAGGTAFYMPADMQRNAQGRIEYKPSSNENNAFGLAGQGLDSVNRGLADAAATERERIRQAGETERARLRANLELELARANSGRGSAGAVDAAAQALALREAQNAAELAAFNAQKAAAGLAATTRNDDGATSSSSWSTTQMLGALALVVGGAVVVVSMTGKK